MTSPIKTLFLSSWNAGITLFTECKNSSILEDVFTTASNMCSNDDIVQMILRAKRMLLDRILESKASNPTDIQNLEEMGNDLARLIMMSNDTFPSLVVT
jgi:hypothetical protein